MESEAAILLGCVHDIARAAGADDALLPWIADMVMDMRQLYMHEYGKSDGFHWIVRHAERLLSRAHARRRLVRGSVRARILACMCLAHSMQDDNCIECTDTAYTKHLNAEEGSSFTTVVVDMFTRALELNAHVSLGI